MSELIDHIRAQLYELRDTGSYKQFNSSLIPTIDPDSVLGVRTPALRSLAKRLAREPDIGDFLDDLPHRYFEENQLHAFVLETIRDCDVLMRRLNAFLPYVDNWATCDCMSPKLFRTHRSALMPQILRWLNSPHTYTVRYAVNTLMSHFLDDDFTPDCLALVAAIHSEEYYINMMNAWYFATALAKQYDSTIPYLEQKRLDPWVHNKTIQKAIESRRISAETKLYLRTLKIKAN